MSSILNSLSGVIYKHCVKRFLKNNPSEKTISNVLKLIVAISGAVCTCLVFLIEHLGEIISVTAAFTGITDGPLLGMFTLGVLFPRANAKVRSNNYFKLFLIDVL
jgi:Na+/proline symporter